MRRAALLTLLLAACSTDVTRDIEQLRDRACACKDVVCARAVLDDLVTLARNTGNARGDEDKAQAAARGLAACATTAGVSRKELEDAIKKTDRN